MISGQFGSVWVPIIARAGSGTDTLIGGGGPDKLWGGTEDDTLDGGGGDDSLRRWQWEATSINSLRPRTDSDLIDEAADVDFDLFDFRDYTTAITLDLEDTSGQELAEGFYLEISSPTGIERVYGTSGADNIRGNARPNQLSGLAGEDVLNGGDDSDTIWGGGW